MEKQAGVVLTDVWDSLRGNQKAQVLDQIVDIQQRLVGARFARFGSLYYVEDIPDNAGPDSSVSFDLAGNDCGAKGELDIDRGPWSTVTEVSTAIAKKEIATAKAGIRYPLMLEGLFHGPRQYQPNLSKKLPALENYLRVAPHVLPENQATHASVKWHGDLYSQNIFVNPEEPSQILGIIDWQSSSAHPLFMQVGRPAFLDYNGPVPKDLGKIPLPSNFDQMDADAQRKAKTLHRAQTLHNLYLVRCLQANEAVLQALQNRSTLRHQVSVVPGLVLMDYEPLLNSLLRDVGKEWAQIVQVQQQEEEDGELWAQGIALMATFIADTGCFKHWDGRVDEIDYEKSRRELEAAVQRFLEREAKNDDERRKWLDALTFVD
ncbi:phosphotransferase enzyme [Aspergillus tubingensis]|uniref:Altered inheritance of mitochondria protein 9, mitochondrial n=1 Tax=Aspergillus tubingensis TaxID=5068 RepID=A0A9W6ELC7_ASPTU|nr:phosphotransferase enzyme [Aspergillus tubingensis]